jgi:hypothetical protein
MTLIDFNMKLEILVSKFLDNGGGIPFCVSALRGLADDVDYADEMNQEWTKETDGHNVWHLPDMSTEELSLALSDVASHSSAG